MRSPQIYMLNTSVEDFEGNTFTLELRGVPAEKMEEVRNALAEILL